MEMIQQFEEKIHVQKDVHQIMTLYEHISIYMDMNKHDNALFFVGR